MSAREEAARPARDLRSRGKEDEDNTDYKQEEEEEEGGGQGGGGGVDSGSA